MNTVDSAYEDIVCICFGQRPACMPHTTLGDPGKIAVLAKLSYMISMLHKFDNVKRQDEAL